MPRLRGGRWPAPAGGLATCIYCLIDKPLAAFNEEHVIPESFGGDMVLTYSVCRECNTLFGAKLEEFFGRDSYEGILRYHFGLSEPPQLQQRKKKQRFRPRRVLIRIAKPGEWNGALLELKGFHQNGTPDCDLAPQAALRRKGTGQLTHFHIDDMPEKNSAEEKGFETKQVQAAGANKEARAEVVRRLETLGYKAQSWQEGPGYPTDTVRFEVLTTIDEVIKRTVAKILFNYLAFARGADFVLSEDFNGIRRYIREGTKPDWHFFESGNEPILGDDATGLRQTEAHLMVVEWDARRRGINGRLSLFNRITHRVRLCHDYRGIYREIRSGHSFDPRTGEIKELLPADKRLHVVKATPRGIVIR